MFGCAAGDASLSRGWTWLNVVERGWRGVNGKAEGWHAGCTYVGHVNNRLFDNLSFGMRDAAPAKRGVWLPRPFVAIVAIAIAVLCVAGSGSGVRAEYVISEVELLQFKLPLKTAFTTSKGSSTTCYGIFVRLVAGEEATGREVVGLGTILPRTLVTHETRKDAWAGAVAMRENLLGERFGLAGDDAKTDTGVVRERVATLGAIANAHKLTTKYPPASDRQLRATLCGFDMALLDLVGKIHGEPIWKLLRATELGPGATSFAERKQIKRSAPTFSVTDSAQTLRHKVDRAHRDYEAMRLKIGRDQSADIASLTAVAKELVRDNRPTTAIWVDVNQAWHDTATSVARLKELADAIAATGFNNLFIVEQPTDELDFEALAAVTREARSWGDRYPFKIAIMADESLWLASDVERIVAMDAADMVNIKMQKAGGMFESMKIGRYLAAHAPEMGVYVGGLVMTDVGAWANVQVGFALPRLDYQTSGAPRRNFPVNVAGTPVEYSEGRRIDRPLGAGLGTGLDMKNLEPYITRELRSE